MGVVGAVKMNEIQRLQQLAGIINEEEGPVDKEAIGHVDNEPDMIRQQLYILGSDAVALYKMLGDLPNGDFPHWWQGKIIKAVDYIQAAKNYLDSELNAPENDTFVSDDAEDYSDPSGVSN